MSDSSMDSVMAQAAGGMAVGARTANRVSESVEGRPAPARPLPIVRQRLQEEEQLAPRRREGQENVDDECRKTGQIEAEKERRTRDAQASTPTALSGS